MLYYGILAINGLVCVLLIAVVLMQRSEGGALGGGGSPTGLVTTRGAGDLLTRTTWVLFSLFLILSLSLTLIGGQERSSQAIINRLKLQSINPDAVAAHTGGAPKPTVQPAAPVAPQPGSASNFAAPAPVISLPALPTAPAKSKP